MNVGMKVGHLRVIFKLPETIPLTLLGVTVPSWPKEPLAYLEWYQLSSNPGRYHNMYTVQSPQPSQLGGSGRHSQLFQITPGEVVPLKTIQQTCQLILLAHADESWPAEWNSSTVLDKCSNFLLNNWASKYAYQTIW